MISHSSHARSCRKRHAYRIIAAHRPARGRKVEVTPRIQQDSMSTTTPQHSPLTTHHYHNTTTLLSDLGIFLSAQLYISCKPLTWPRRNIHHLPHPNLDSTRFQPRQAAPMMQAMPDSRSQTFEEIYGPPENFLEIEVRLTPRRFAA